MIQLSDVFLMLLKYLYGNSFYQHMNNTSLIWEVTLIILITQFHNIELLLINYY